MATENSRDIELRIAATTSGSEQVKKLASELDQLSKEGGEATPEFVRLGEALDRVAAQGDAVAALNAVEQQVEQTSAAFAEARTRVEQLQAALNEQRATTEGFRAAQITAQQAVDLTAKGLREQEAALNLLRAEYQGAERNTDAYRAKNRELQRSIAELENTLAEQRTTLRSANGDLRQNETALTKAESAYNRASTAARRLEQTLSGQTSKLAQSRAELERLGVSATTAADAQSKVEAAFTQVRQKLTETARSYTQLASVTEAVARSNERNAALARQAAEQRADAEARAAAATRQAAREQEAAALRAKLSTEQQAAAARQAAAAQKVLNDTFGIAGVRSTEAIKAEIDQLSRALVELRNNSNVTAAEFNRAFQSAQGRLGALQAELNGAPEALGRTNVALGAVRSAFSQLIAIYGVFELSQKFIDANIQLETLRRSLALVTGSTEAATRQIQLLQDTASRAGVSVGDISAAFIKFQASLNGANVPLETTEGLFKAVINASGQLGLSSQRTSLILEALAQTASKGVVSMEELRQQLGDSLPGALSLTAKGLGITTAELIELTESGRLLADDFLPALRKSLVATYGEGQTRVEGLRAAWNRFKNTLTETSQIVGDSGPVSILSKALDNLSGRITAVTTTWRTFSTLVSQTSTNTQFDLSRPIESLRSFGSAVQTEIGRLARPEFVKSIADFRTALTNFDVTDVAASYRRLQIESDKLAESYKKTADQYVRTAQESRSLEQETNRLKNAAQALSTQATSTASAWVGLEVSYKKVRTEVEKNITQAQKLAEAQKIQGEASVAVAQLSLNEQQTRQASADAAVNNALALRNLADLRQTEADVIRAQIEALRAEAERVGDNTGARREAIKALQDTLAIRTAEAQKARESAEATQIDAEAKLLAVRVYQDNSAALTQLRDAYLQTERALSVTIALEKQGQATKEDVRRATILAAEAEALYQDAVNDSAAAVERKRQAINASLSVQEAKLRLEQQEIQTSIEYAKRRGDEQAVIELTIRQKRLEIEIIEAKARAQREEIRLQQIQLDVERAALDQSDPLYAQKKQELDIRIQLLDVKRLETAATEQQVERIELEIRALRDRANASRETADGFVSDRDREATALDRVADASDRAADSERRRRRVNADGFSADRSGNAISAAGETFLSLFNQARSAGLDDATAQGIVNQFTDAQGNVPFFDNPGQLRFGGQGSTLSQAFSNAIAQAIRNRPSQAQQGGFAGDQGQRSIRVDINLNGQTTAVNVASQADATALQSLLRQLQQAAQRSG